MFNSLGTDTGSQTDEQKRNSIPQLVQQIFISLNNIKWNQACLLYLITNSMEQSHPGEANSCFQEILCFIEHKSSLLFSQEPVIHSYIKPYEWSPHPPTLFL